MFDNLFVQAEDILGAVTSGKVAGPLREGGNLLWGMNGPPTKENDPFAKFRSSPLFKSSQKLDEPGWTTNDFAADPGFVKLAERSDEPSGLPLSEGSPATNPGVEIPAEWRTIARGGQGKTGRFRC